MPRRSLGRASLLLMGSTWVHNGMGVIASIMVARALGPAAVGEIAVNLGLAALVMAVLLPGFAQAHLKRLAEGKDPGVCLGTMATIQVALTALLLLALLAARAAGAVPGSAPQVTVFAFMLGAQIVGRFGDVFLRVLIARELVVDHGAIVLGGRVVRLAATAAVLALAPAVTWIAATFFAESVVAMAAAAAVLSGRHGIRPRRPTRESLRSYWEYARPFLVTTPVALLQDSLDRYLVGRWAGLDAAGYYHVARGVWEVVSSVLAPPGTFLLTRMSSLYASRSAAGDLEARKLFYRGLDKTLFMTTVLALGFWMFADVVIGVLYGPAFLPARGSLRILLLAAIAANLVNPYLFILLALDQAHRLIPVNLVRLAVYVALLFVLVPGHLIPGAPAADQGAAVARLCLIAFPAWVYFGWTRRLAGIAFMWRGLVYVGGFAVGIVVFHGVQRLADLTPAPPSVSLAMAATAAFLVYVGYLLLAHPAGTRENFAYARQLLASRR
jgi:O-antigen/teichoic acid export membrane protein